jgi:signal transduction histidine kinase
VPDGFPVTGDGKPQTVDAGGRRWRALATELPEGGVLQAAISLSETEARARRLRTIVAIVLLAALVLTGLAARTLAQLALAPLGALRDAAGRIAETGTRSERMPRGDGTSEVDELAGSLDSMLDRLEQAGAAREDALAAARRFAADAGHELRTPLMSLQANLAAAASPGDPAALEAAERDTDRLAGLVGQLQALARGEAGPPPRLQEIDLADLLDSELAALRRRHPEMTAELEAVDEVRVQGDAEGLSMLVANLLENAARHGASRVGASLARHGAGALITVDDDGPGIPEAEREAVVERFVRGAGAQGEGSGLGLAIAAAQAARHGGSIALMESPLGGLRVHVELDDLGV